MNFRVHELYQVIKMKANLCFVLICFVLFQPYSGSLSLVRGNLSESSSSSVRNPLRISDFMLHFSIEIDEYFVELMKCYIYVYDIFVFKYRYVSNG